MVTLVILTVVVALIFDYSNGFHDAANSIATVVATRVLRPSYAVIWAAAFNFLAAFFFGVKVATTIGKGVVDPSVVTQYVILTGLIGAIGWNVTTWYLGLPTSSSHALIGSFAGAAIARAGIGGIILVGLGKILPSVPKSYVARVNVLKRRIVNKQLRVWNVIDRGYPRWFK